MALEMKNIAACLAVLIGLNANAGASQVTTVIDFEDQGQPGASLGPTLKPIDGYTITFGSYITDLSVTSPWAEHGPAYSGQYSAVARNASVYRRDGGFFAVKSLWLKSWSGNAVVSINGGRLDNTKMTPVTMVHISDTTWTKVDLNYSNVEIFGMLADGDKIMYDNLILTSVPEPTTYAMLFAGMGLLAYAGRRKRVSSPPKPQ